MISDKTARDRANNQKFKDTYVHASQGPWLPFFPRIEFKVLRTTQETGHWTVLLKCAKGSGIPRHEHLGAGEYYVIAGKMEVRGGVENGGITAITGDYGYEPNDVIHDMTNFPKDSILYFTNLGPIRYIDDDDNTVGFLDWQGVLRQRRKAGRRSPNELGKRVKRRKEAVCRHRESRVRIGMKIGIITYAVDLSALANKAEELGFDSLWAPEHNTMLVHIAPMNTAYRMHLEPDGTPQPLYRSGKFVDPFIALARASAVTTKITLGTGVCLRAASC